MKTFASPLVGLSGQREKLETSRILDGFHCPTGVSPQLSNSDLQHLEHKGGGKDLGSEVQLDKHPFSRLPGWLWEPTRTADLKYTVEVV